jgi:hypothetical protein
VDSDRAARTAALLDVTGRHADQSPAQRCTDRARRGTAADSAPRRTGPWTPRRLLFHCDSGRRVPHAPRWRSTPSPTARTWATRTSCAPSGTARSSRGRLRRFLRKGRAASCDAQHG